MGAKGAPIVRRHPAVVAALGQIPNKASDDEDRSYTTALCVLSLEIYYRYFTPLFEVR